jgi:hypothetical protein
LLIDAANEPARLCDAVVRAPAHAIASHQRTVRGAVRAAVPLAAYRKEVVDAVAPTAFLDGELLDADPCAWGGERDGVG